MKDYSVSEQALRDSGLKATVPRVVIYDYLLTHKTHPTCDEIYSAIKDSVPRLSLASVYNVTEKLSEEGLLLRLIAPNGDRHYDSTLKFHGHFYCRVCGRMMDLDVPELEDIYNPIPGSTTESVEVIATGTCPKCS